MRMTLISALILVGLGATLYQVKTGIDERQEHLHRLEMNIARTKRDIATLAAEWAYRSRPERVVALAEQLLEMKPIAQDRIIPIEGIPIRFSVGTTAFPLAHSKATGPQEIIKVSQ